MHLRIIPDDTHLPFMKWAKIRTPISLALIILSFVLFFTIGVNEGIDFKGGTQIEVRSHQATADVSDIRSKVDGLGLGDVQIQGIGSANGVLIRIAVQPGGEAAQQGVIDKRDGDLTAALIINYNVGGTASNGVDYAALSGTLTIPASAASADIVVTPIDDPLLEGNESVIVALTNNLNYDVGTPGSATLVIRDNEKPTVTVSPIIPQVSEQGDTTGQFRLTRTSSIGDLTVYLGVSGTATSGSDYVPFENPVVIPDGSTTLTIDVIPFHDLIFEPTETIILTLPTNANYNVASSAAATVEILDDGTSPIPGVGFCFATSAISESQSPGIAVALSTTSSVPVVVSYRVLGGTAPASRYVLPVGTLTIGISNLVAFIPLQIVNDTNAQPAQTIRVVLFNPMSATLDGIKIHTYTILDDDTASVSVTAVPASAAETGLVAGNFRIARAGPTNASQLVNFQLTGTASAPTDYAPLGNAATIPAGAAFVDLPVTPADDNTMEFSQTVVLTLISAAGGNIVSPNVATVTITDNDTNTLPVVTLTSTNHPYAVEGGGSGEFHFARSGPTTNALALAFTISGTANNGADYTNIPNTVTIPVGQSNVVVTVAAVDDALIEGDETVSVKLTEGSAYRVAYPSAAVVTIQDNDQRVWIDASDFTAAEPGTDTGEFTFSRFGTTNTPVTVFYDVSGTAGNGVDYASITNSIVIPAGSLTVKLPLVPLDDNLVEGPETVILSLQADSAYTPGTPVSATVTINDDEPMITVSTVVTNVLEGSGSNGVFRVTRTGNPALDLTAHLAIGGAATFGVDYPPFATNIYFSCGIMSIDLFVTPTNEAVAEGNETVTVTLLPDPGYSILSPSNAVLNIVDAGNNQTPVVLITSPKNRFAFLNGTNAGLILNATVIDDNPSNTLTWTKVSGPDSYVFGDTNAANTSVLFTNVGVYLLRLTADDGQLSGHADLLVFVSSDVLTATNILHWALDEGGGTNAADTSGNGRDGTFSGLPSWTTNGAIAGALSFAGTNDCVRQSGGSNTLSGLNAFTVALWVKPSPVIFDRGFLTADDTDVNPTFSLSTRAIAACGSSTNLIDAVVTTTSGTVHRVSANNAVKPGQWQHFALTWTNGGSPKLYINGQLDQPLSGFTTASGVLTNCPQFIIGKGAFDSPASWDGSLDDVRVFAAALSAEEILAIASAPSSNRAPVVDAGLDVAVQLGISVTLTGLVSDDVLPDPPASVTNWWTYLGTNVVTIPNVSSLTNTFVFSVPGDYIFRLMAFDGELTSFDDVTVTVLEPILVSVYASDSDANELGPDPGEFTIARTGDTNQLTVYLAVSGTASNGVDCVVLTNVVFFALGSNSVTLPVVPVLDDRIEGDENITLTVLTNAAYFVNSGPAIVTIHDSPYGLWSIQQFTLEQLTFPNISGAAADFDHDALVNFVEYAFNLDPKTPDVNPAFQYGFEVSTNDNKNHLTLTYTRRLPPTDVAYSVYASTNLLAWNTGTNFIEEFFRSNNVNGITETVKARARAPFPATTNLFMKINVQVQQVPAP